MNLIKKIKEKWKTFQENRKIATYGEPLYPEYKILMILTIYLEEVGISTLNEDYYYLNITYNDGTIATLWNANKWHSWLSSGTIYFSNGEKLSWKDKSPPLETLYKYKKYIQKLNNVKTEVIIEVKTEEKLNIDKYLPINLQRKRKLENITKL